MLITKSVHLGDVNLVIMDFEKAGDLLPKHNHTEDDVHFTVVARGAIVAYSHDWSKEAVSGQILDFNAGEPHEIKALEDGTRIVNIRKKYHPPV